MTHSKQEDCLPGRCGGEKELENFAFDGRQHACAVVLDADFKVIVCCFGRNSYLIVNFAGNVVPSATKDLTTHYLIPYLLSVGNAAFLANVSFQTTTSFCLAQVR
jgi:hypothetical protein